MESEKVKEIKKVLEEGQFNTITHHQKEGKPIKISFSDILTLINELESEKETLKFNMQETEKASFNINQMNGNLVLENQQLKDRIAELENKIENGTLIELPCKVGDTAYVIEYYEIKEYLVATIYIDENNEVFLKLERNHNLIYQYPYNVWFTKAEAEKKLAELKGEEKWN